MIWAIAQTWSLCPIEDGVRDQPPGVGHARRLQDALRVWAALKTRAKDLLPCVLAQSTFGNASRHLLDDYEALIGYLRDARFKIDNNLIGNDSRRTAVGRKHWLVIGHRHAGWRSVIISSLIASCRRRGINPEIYLTDVPRRPLSP